MHDRFKKNKDIDEVTRNFIIFKDGMEIMLPDKFKPSKEYLEYHNDIRFGNF